MNELAHEATLNEVTDEIDEIFQDEFNPELFYKALSNALNQLEDMAAAEAA